MKKTEASGFAGRAERLIKAFFKGSISENDFSDAWDELRREALAASWYRDDWDICCGDPFRMSMTFRDSSELFVHKKGNRVHVCVDGSERYSRNLF